MIIEQKRPPNFNEIAAVFPIVLTKKGILYAWDGVIYSPDGGLIPEQLILHEQTHSNRQEGDPDSWWDKYLSDKLFRFKEELQAHQVEWNVYQSRFKDKNSRDRYLHQMALRLSGEIYGKVTTYKEARNLILSGIS